ncbi:MAG: hypothetical protein EA397_13485 [Deltaproteobacteria bacterium]|nr:MAG: hypothetical protein EA397_13485 [Deltaproteobacteria bacterium]
MKFGRPAPVVMRDLRRKGRTRALRWIRAAVVLGMLLVLIGVLGFFSSSTSEPRLDRLGRAVWGSSATLCLLMATLLVPLEVGYAVVSEREEGTLDLLTMVGLPPGRVLFGVLFTRVLHLLLLLLSLVPLFYIGLSLGGVSPLQILAFVFLLLSYAFALFGVASLVATATRGMVLPMLLTGAWALIFLVFVPVRFLSLHASTSFAVNRAGWEEVVFPFIAIYEQPTSWEAVGVGAGLWIYAGAVALWAARWRFIRVVAQGWSWRAKAWPGLRAGWLLSVAIIGFSWAIAELGEEAVSSWMEGQGLFSVHLTPWVLALYLVVWPLFHGMFLRTVAWLLPRLDRSVERRLPLGPVWIRLVGPLLWRELFTSAQGGLSRVIWALTLGWALVTVLFGILYWPSVEGVYLMAMVGTVGSWVLSSVLISSSIVDERLRRGLPLLTLTRVTGLRVVAAKTLGAWVRVGPLFLLSGLTIALSPYLQPTERAMGSMSRIFGLTIGHQLAITLAWGFSLLALTSAVSVGVAFFFSRGGAARILPPLFAIVVLPTTVFLAMLLESVSPARDELLLLLLPIMPFVGTALFVREAGLIAWASLAILGFVIAVWIVRRSMGEVGSGRAEAPNDPPGV